MPNSASSTQPWMLDGAPGTLVGSTMDARPHGSNPVVVDGIRVITPELKQITVPQQQAVELERNRVSSTHCMASVSINTTVPADVRRPGHVSPCIQVSAVVYESLCLSLIHI